jgi:signal transduction histidine kinase
LKGMRERVGLLGGDFHAGRVDHGFRVLARLPLEPGLS